MPMDHQITSPLPASPGTGLSDMPMGRQITFLLPPLPGPGLSDMPIDRQINPPLPASFRPRTQISYPGLAVSLNSTRFANSPLFKDSTATAPMADESLNNGLLANLVLL